MADEQTTIEELVKIAAGCSETPSLEEIDKMLLLMSQLPGSEADTAIKDALLDMRTVWTAA